MASATVSEMSQTTVEHELMWSIFSAAATNYRADTLLRPFPPQFVSETGDKDIEALKKCVEAMPSPSSGIIPSKAQRNLLQWLLQLPNMSVQSKPLTQLEDLQQLTGERLSVTEPNYLLEIKHSESREQAFQSCRGERRVFYAYHGSRAENFYSIVLHGLHSHLNKTSLFGEGTYLSTEPTVALGFSPWGNTGWRNSVIADSMSVVALCEVIDHPSVKISTSSDESQRRAPNSVSGLAVPDNYVVVTNNDMVRVKYLLVYTKKTTPAARRLFSSSRRRALVSHLQAHGHTLTIGFYILLLILVGVVSSPRFWRKVRQLYEETLYDWVPSQTDTL